MIDINSIYDSYMTDKDYLHTIAKQVYRIGFMTIVCKYWHVLSKLISVASETMNADDSWFLSLIADFKTSHLL